VRIPTLFAENGILTNSATGPSAVVIDSRHGNG
jgi:hypothetical protein